MSDGENQQDNADARTVPIRTALAALLLGLVEAGARHLADHPDALDPRQRRAAQLLARLQASRPDSHPRPSLP